MKQTLHILTLTAFLLGIIAPACGFAWGGKYSLIEICTANGVETRLIANDDPPSDEAPAPMMEDKCQFCFANANLTAFLPDNLSIEYSLAYADKLKFIAYRLSVFSRDTSHEQPRGPPTFI